MQARMIQIPLSGTAASGILAAGTVMAGRIPQAGNGGAVTVIEAQIAAKSGTITVQLVDLGPAGTATAGTICALALAAAGNTPLGTVLATPYVLDPGDYFGLEYAAGTVIYPCYVNVTYLPGK